MLAQSKARVGVQLAQSACPAYARNNRWDGALSKEADAAVSALLVVKPCAFWSRAVAAVEAGGARGSQGYHVLIYNSCVMFRPSHRFGQSFKALEVLSECAAHGCALSLDLISLSPGLTSLASPVEEGVFLLGNLGGQSVRIRVVCEVRSVAWLSNNSNKT
jgi:hypothetical protein